MGAGRLVLPVVVAIGLGLAPPAWPQRTGAPGRADSVAARVAVARRPFDHRWHEQVACARCHGTGAQHRAILVQGPADCAACHHDPGLGRSCAGCHRDKAHDTLVVRARPVSAPGVRRPFDHRWHGGVACTQCHQPGAGDRVMHVPAPTACSGCHHDAASARPCVGCHENKRPGGDTRAIAIAGMKRPFEHQRHERVACRQCHTGVREGAMVVPTHQECSSCHHHGSSGKACVDCHRITGPEGHVGPHAGLPPGRPGSEP